MSRGRRNYPAQAEPEVEEGELSQKISFMQMVADWTFTNDPDRVEDRVRWFFDQCANFNTRPTVALLAVALNTSRQTMWQWEQKGGRLGEIISQAKRILNALLEDWSVNGKINPVSAVWLQKNHFHYRDNIILEATRPEGHLEARMTPEEIAAELQRQIEQDIPIDADYDLPEES